MTDSEMTIRTMINGLKDIPKMTDKRQVARRVRGLILAIKDLQAANKQLAALYKISLRQGERIWSENERLRASLDKRLRASLAEKRKKRKKT